MPPFLSKCRLSAGAVRRARRAVLLVSCGTVIAAVPALGIAAPPSTSPPTDAPLAHLPSFAPLVKTVLPAVVNISVTEKAGFTDEEDQEAPPGEQPFPFFPQSPFDQFLRRFFNQQGPTFPPGDAIQQTALGSGFIIDPSGYIVTNNHVIADADKITVTFQDGTKHVAKLVGRDPKTDLALLKVETDHPLPFVPWGNSDAAQVGDWVLAVGDPFGLGGSVSSGIISARGRDIGAGPYDNFLQIDAAINRGNSGGPTFNLQGQVIGINTAIYSPNGGSVGIAFAIPSNSAKPIIEQLKEHGKVTRSWIGVDVQGVTDAIAKSLNLPKAEGALVANVLHDGPAAKAGIKQGDVILSFNGHNIAQMRDLPNIVADTPIGTTAKITLWRHDHRETLEVTTAELPAAPELAENGGEATMGVTFAPLTASRRESLGVEKDVKGVVIAAIAPDSPLAGLGLQRGDVIESIDQKPVETPQEAAALLNQARHEKGSEKSLLVLLNRHGVNQYVAVTVENGGENG
jgi:serine protease Do